MSDAMEKSEPSSKKLRKVAALSSPRAALPSQSGAGHQNLSTFADPVEAKTYHVKTYIF